MGFRFRKSINLGGGFRLNISKSGIGCSFGVKGLRITAKSNGGIRTTFSLPGTGLSYVSDSRKKKQKKSSNNSSTITQDVQSIVQDFNDIVQDINQLLASY